MSVTAEPPTDTLAITAQLHLPVHVVFEASSFSNPVHLEA